MTAERAVPQPPDVVARVRAAYRRDAQCDRPEIWVLRRPEAEVLGDADDVATAVAAGEHLPLAGTVLAVKDNIDVAGLPTTAGHPAYARVAERTATAVQRLLDAGAVLMGKTNLDQFATGLAGTRSPYGPVRSATHPDRVAGGSSSGAAAAVGLGIVDVAIGTDTAGSGRVPAAFNRIVGIKPTLGLVPKDGVVPACHSYDCVTVFARTMAEAQAALAVMTGPSRLDPTSRTWPADVRLAAPDRPLVAIPRDDDLASLDLRSREHFEAVIGRLTEQGVRTARLDLTPFVAGARLLYGGALVVERYAAFGEFLAANPDDADPSVAFIAAHAAGVTGAAVARDQLLLSELRRQALAELDGFDALLLPTAPEHPTLEAVAADPLGVNTRLGRFTNFVNLFDLAAVAVPAGTSSSGEFGVSVITRRFDDQVGLDLAARLLGEALGPYPAVGTSLAVFGAHLRGEPLNDQLQALGARFAGEISTSADYAMYALEDGSKPVVAPTPTGGASLDGEEWLLSPAALGTLLATLPRPMALGKVTLADGREVVGFTGSLNGRETEITSCRSWRRYQPVDPARLVATPTERSTS